MKGKYLNSVRRNFYASMFPLVEEIQRKVETTEYEKFDEYDEYREDFYLDYTHKLTRAMDLLLQVHTLLEE